jgi:hypothetical protein
MIRFSSLGLAALSGLAAGAAQAQTPPPPADTTPPAVLDAPVQTAPPAPTADAAPPAPTDAPPPPPTVTVPPPALIIASDLRAPDLFSGAPGPTGFHPTLWDGASADLARLAAPMAAQKPLSPAFAAFALRLFSTSAHAPDGAAADADLAAARIGVVLALGGAAQAQTMLGHTPGVAASPALSQVAAETDLVLGQDDQACQVGDALTQGKDQPYFRRLRAFCLIRAGSADAAQLTFDLASSQARDDVYKRLMSAAISKTPPGPADMSNGLNFALSSFLKLDLTPALPAAWRPILVAMTKDEAADPGLRQAAQTQLNAHGPGDPPVIAAPVLIPLEAGDLKSARAARAQIERNDAAGATVLELALIDAALTTAEGKPNAEVMDQLVERGVSGDPSEHLRAQQAAALYGALGAAVSSQARAEFASFDLGRSPASQARLYELQMVRAVGDAALLSLWLGADAGPAGPPPVERAEIVRALMRSGFGENARAIALEGLIGLITPPPPPPPEPKAKAPPRRKRHAR